MCSDVLENVTSSLPSPWPQPFCCIPVLLGLCLHPVPFVSAHTRQGWFCVCCLSGVWWGHGPRLTYRNCTSHGGGRVVLLVCLGQQSFSLWLSQQSELYLSELLAYLPKAASSLLGPGSDFLTWGGNFVSFSPWVPLLPKLCWCPHRYSAVMLPHM